MKKTLTLLFLSVGFALQSIAQCTTGGGSTTYNSNFKAPELNKKYVSPDGHYQLNYDSFTLPGTADSSDRTYQFSGLQYIIQYNQFVPNYGTKIYLTISTADKNNQDSVIATGLSPVNVKVAKTTKVKARVHFGPQCEQPYIASAYKIELTLETLPCFTTYKDADGDGYGDPSITGYACPSIEKGFVTNASDCNDNNKFENPSAKWYPDLDGDGFGDMNATPVVSCIKPANARIKGGDIVANGEDCNDNDPLISPSATEIPGNTIDEDCDGFIDNNNSLAMETNAGVEIPNTANWAADKTFTVEFWVKPRVDRVFTNYNILRKGSGTAIYTYYYYTTSYLISRFNGKDNYSTIETNKWTHFAFVGKPDTLKIYQNGVLTTTSIENTSIGAGDLKIGSGLNSYDGISGIIEDLRFWSVEKTNQEILASYNSNISENDANLVAYYKFNQGIPNSNNTSITQLLDASKNAYNGTLYGFTLTDTLSNFVKGIPSLNIPAPTITNIVDIELNNESLSIFPNPSNGIVTINGLEKTSSIALYNSLGTLILEQTNNSSQAIIDLTQYEKGIYLLRIGNKVHKVIKE